MEKKTEKKLEKKYSKMVGEATPASKMWFNCFKAFVVGGIICSIGQFIMNLGLYYGVGEENIGTFVSIIMIFIGALLTGLSIYDSIGKHAGAGSVVPITGFANSVVSPAMEFKTEGYILGIGAKMFTIAGPVLVYGISSSVIVGIIHYFIK